MKMRLLLLSGITFVSLFVIIGCSKDEDIPAGFSEQSYNDFTYIYSDYKETKGANKEVEGLDILFEYRKKDEKGELSSQESKVREALNSLVSMYNASVKDNQGAFPGDSESKALVEVLKGDSEKVPDLEKEIEEALELVEEGGGKPKNNTDDDVSEQRDLPEQKEDKETVKNECPEPYTEEDCEKYYEYYTNGDGQYEPKGNNNQIFEDSEDNTVASGQDLNDPLEASRNIIVQLHSDAVNLRLTFDPAVEVKQLSNGNFYILSSFTRVNVVNYQEKYYEYEMLLDSNYNYIDAYVPGWGGQFSQPLQVTQ